MRLRRTFCSIGVALAAALPARAEPAPEDTLELVQIMAGLPVTRHDGPIAEMHGRDALFARLYDAARSGDAQDLGVFLLYGQAALLTTDGAIEESFVSAMKPLYDADPDRLLAAAGNTPWLIGGTCYLIGSWFGFQGMHAGEHEGFLAAERERITAAMARPLAERCIAQITAPDRPY